MSPIGTVDGPQIKPCILSRTTNLSIPDSTFTEVVWTTPGEVLDHDDWHVSGNLARIAPRFAPNFSNPAFTGQGAGTVTFLATLNVRWASNTTGKRRARIVKNGATVAAEQAVEASTWGVAPMSMSAYVLLGVGDYVLAEVWQSSGAALDLDGLASTFTLEVR